MSSLSQQKSVPRKSEDRHVFSYRGLSMKGTFRPGDFLRIEKSDPNDLRRGDVIAFQGNLERETGHPIVHRIIAFKRPFFVTQGDNNRLPDSPPVAPNDLIGKVVSFERKGRRRRVIGGMPGLIRARLLFSAHLAVSWVYRIIRRLLPTRLIGGILLKLSKFPVRKIQISTEYGPATKWIFRNRTIAVRNPGEERPRFSFLARCLIAPEDRNPETSA